MTSDKLAGLMTFGCFLRIPYGFYQMPATQRGVAQHVRRLAAQVHTACAPRHTTQHLLAAACALSRLSLAPAAPLPASAQQGGLARRRAAFSASLPRARGMAGTAEPPGPLVPPGAGPPGTSGPGSGGAGAPPSAMPQEKFFDVTAANFAQIINDSPAPVVIVCYVPEEGGISQTILKKVEAEVSRAPGVLLGRLDCEKEQELAMSLQLQEVPTVFAIHDKKVVNKIQGRLNDTEIQGFVANCSHLAALASGEGMVAQASEHLTKGEVEEALRLYGEVLAKPKEHSEPIIASAMAGMAMCALALRDLEGAKSVIQALRDNHKMQLSEPIVKQAITAVDMAVAAEDCGDQAQLEAALADNADDHDARSKLAILLYAKGDSKGAMDHALTIMKRDRSWNEDGGRKLVLQFFDSLGNQHPDVIEARKRLSALLFI